MSNDDHQRLIDELKSIKNYLAAAQDIIKSGFMPNLSGLEERVTVLCETMKTLPRDIQQQCLPEFTSLIDDLNLCEKNMRAWHDKAKNDPKS